MTDKKTQPSNNEPKDEEENGQTGKEEEEVDVKLKVKDKDEKRLAPKTFETSPFVLMLEIHELLSILDYEKRPNFINQPNQSNGNGTGNSNSSGITLNNNIPRLYFAFENKQNPTEQFHKAIELISWILKEQFQTKTFKAPNLFDDPNTVATEMLNELKRAGLKVDSFSPMSLRKAYGNPLCLILHKLLTHAASKKKGIKFNGENKMIYKEEHLFKENNFDMTKQNQMLKDIEEEEDVEAVYDESDDDNDDEANDGLIKDGKVFSNEEQAQDKNKSNEMISEVQTEDAKKEDDSDDDDESKKNNYDEDPLTKGAEDTFTKKKKKKDQKEENVGVSVKDWMIELEQIAPQLIVRLNMDLKNWRTHVEQLTKQENTISELFNETTRSLTRICDDVTKVLIRIKKREAMLNNDPHIAKLLADFKKNVEELRIIKQKHKLREDASTKLVLELNQLDAEINEVKRNVEEKEKELGDSSKLTQIGKAIFEITEEIKEINLRSGVLQNSVWQAKAKTQRINSSSMWSPTKTKNN